MAAKQCILHMADSLAGLTVCQSSQGSTSASLTCILATWSRRESARYWSRAKSGSLGLKSAHVTATTSRGVLKKRSTGLTVHPCSRSHFAALVLPSAAARCLHVTAVSRGDAVQEICIQQGPRDRCCHDAARQHCMCWREHHGNVMAHKGVRRS